MLTKDKCNQAINAWKETRTDFTKIKKIIDPTAVFKLTQENCDWVRNNNKNSNFHTYAGVYKEKFILIVIPLDENGKERKLDKYLTINLTHLKDEITLIETDVVTTVKKTTLSKNLEITKYRKEVDLPTYNEPTITERASVKDIEKWKNECLDWFYYECKESNGQNIFRAFTVPFADLGSEAKKQSEVIVLFGFKHSSIYQMQIPILIFVTTTDETTGVARIIRTNKEESTFEANTSDWARPCPPMCKNNTDYVLLSN